MTEDNSAKLDKKTEVETNIVVGAPVKITRAVRGSLGKDTRVDLIQKPDNDWLDVDLLDEAITLQSAQTGYNRWVERTGRLLKKIETAGDASLLPEMLAHEDPLVQETAEKKLKELEGKEETASDSRIDIIDISEEEE